MDTAPVVNGGSSKFKNDILTQNMFRRVVAKATSRGMVVNTGKIKLLCVHDALTYQAGAQTSVTVTEPDFSWGTH